MTSLQVITTDALVTSDVWRKMAQVAVNRSFNQITVRNNGIYLLFFSTYPKLLVGDPLGNSPSYYLHNYFGFTNTYAGMVFTCFVDPNTSIE